MLPILKKYDLKNIKIKFIIIYILNVTDILFTLFLLKSGAFMEANIFMRKILQYKEISFILKLGLPLILLYVLYKRLKHANNKQLIIGNILINICTLSYALINFSHLFWIFYYFFL